MIKLNTLIEMRAKRGKCFSVGILNRCGQQEAKKYISFTKAMKKSTLLSMVLFVDIANSINISLFCIFIFLSNLNIYQKLLTKKQDSSIAKATD